MSKVCYANGNCYVLKAYEEKSIMTTLAKQRICQKSGEFYFRHAHQYNHPEFKFESYVLEFVCENVSQPMNLCDFELNLQ